MRRRLSFGVVCGTLLLAGCGDGGGTGGVFEPLAAPFQPAATEPEPVAVDPGTALVEARRCGRALAVAARCNYLRDDRDFAALRFGVLQGLDSRYGTVVDAPRMTEAVDLAVLDRMGTIGSCNVASADLAAVQDGLRDVLGSCAAE